MLNARKHARRDGEICVDQMTVASAKERNKEKTPENKNRNSAFLAKQVLSDWTVY